MTIISFHGTIEINRPDIVERVLQNWLPDENIRMEQRQVFEAYLDGENIEIYCHMATPPNSLAFFLIEGHIDDSREGAEAKLEALAQHCRDFGLSFNIDYEEVDADGAPLSAEQTIR